jgi:hypothetical protein
LRKAANDSCRDFAFRRQFYGVARRFSFCEIFLDKISKRTDCGSGVVSEKMSYMNGYDDKLEVMEGRIAGRSPLNVVLACEDFSAGMHALGTFDKIFSTQGKKIRTNAQSVWKFDLLGVTALQEIAAEEAASADLIIISMHGPGILTETVRSWIELWMESREHEPGVLVLLLDDADADGSREYPVEAHLKACAERAGMEFLSHKTSGRRALDDFELALCNSNRAQIFKILEQGLFAEVGHRSQGRPRTAESRFDS